MNTFTLTRQEIGNAIVEYIAKYREHKLFYPFKIVKTSPTLNLADVIQIELEFMPRGTFYPETEHSI